MSQEFNGVNYSLYCKYLLNPQINQEIGFVCCNHLT